MRTKPSWFRRQYGCLASHSTTSKPSLASCSAVAHRYFDDPFKLDGGGIGRRMASRTSKHENQGGRGRAKKALIHAAAAQFMVLSQQRHLLWGFTALKIRPIFLLSRSLE